MTFGDMVAGAFGIKADTKKSDIGKYFTDIESTMTTVKKKLQDEVAKNGNYVKVKTVVDKFITDTLDKIAAGAKEAAKGATGSDVIGNAVKDAQDAAPADKTAVNSIVKGIKTIVDVVLKDKGNADANGAKIEDTERKSIGRLLSTNANAGEEKHAGAASASIGAVTGADILQAIAKSGDVVGEVEIDAATNAAEIAVAKKGDQKDLKANQKDAIVAAGITLRAMAKDGKFASKNNEEKSANAVNGVAASAVGKTLSTLIIAIRNTVDNGKKDK
ncbi:Variable major protein (plasmid) [Borrelia nietonii YOR]|uniref:Variable large protein n=2 Tax=Borrelia TaxID=138 RepID=W5SBN4_9SPIR|nr:Variable major protein [Borrelia nietonii YOR]